VLQSLLSGPIDIDKMDYLTRDSLHAGVPYGRNFDQSRLIGSLCLNAAGNALAITEKGRTAAEMMVFARYVMFSEVYWHHAVRSATAMLQRAFHALRDRLDLAAMFRQDEQFMKEALLEESKGTKVECLTNGLFGTHRKLFKRADQYSLFQHAELYERLARRPYESLVTCGNRLADQISRSLGRSVAAEQVLLDAPPQKREIEIDIDVYFPKERQYRTLAEVSPVVRTLAEKQFDDYVKRVRIFVAPEIAQDVCGEIDCSALLKASLADIDDGVA
jgi:HD superfamily phosphohydrolase